MRGDDPQHESMFSYVTPEKRVRADHPLRPIRRMTDAALTRLSPARSPVCDNGGPSVPPEQLLRPCCCEDPYSIRSERLLMEELDYSVLYRWFVGLSMDDPVWDATTFTKNRDRLLAGDIADASRRCSRRSKPRASCLTSISPSTAHCWRRGPVTRASGPRTATRRRRTIPRIRP